MIINDHSQPHFQSTSGLCETMAANPLTAAEIEDERALVDSYGMLGKGIQEAIEIHNSRLGQMRRAVRSRVTHAADIAILRPCSERCSAESL